MAFVDAVVLLGSEDAAQRGFNAEGLKVIPGDKLAIDALGLTGRIDRERSFAAAENVRERRRFLLKGPLSATNMPYFLRPFKIA